MVKNSGSRLAISLFCLMGFYLTGAKVVMASTGITEADTRMVANCKFLGSVRGFSMFGAEMGARRAMREAEKKALELNATHVVWDRVAPDPYGFQTATGKAYQCDPNAVATSNNPSAGSTPATPTAPATSNTPDLQNVYRIANQTTVLIEGQGRGSGVIIARSGNTYYVLTARHVVATKDEYTLVTANGKKFLIDYSRVRKFANIDLALVPFTSNEVFQVAQLGKSEQISQGEVIFVSGWPAVDQAITRPTHQVTDGRLTGLQRGDSEGYELTYNNATAPGMSGGPVFDVRGRVIGIHGRAAGNQEIGKVGINLGIPIHLFLRQAPQAGLNLQQLGLKP